MLNFHRNCEILQERLHKIVIYFPIPLYTMKSKAYKNMFVDHLDSEK